jgi:aerobic carbon-monoxide dehydrogenase medium subunit
MPVAEFIRPRKVNEVLDRLAEYGGEAKVIAGGQSLMVLMHEGLLDPKVLVSLTGVRELDGIDVDGQARIGALCTHAQIMRHPEIRARWPVLAAAEEAVSTVQIRNRGTLCGNLAHAYPTADPPAALMVLDAVLRLRSLRAERAIPVEEFFTGPLTTVLAEDELIVSVTLPPPPAGARYSYRKYAIRPLDFAIVGVAVRIASDGEGPCRDVRVAVNGGANRPVRMPRAEQALEHRPLTAESIEAAAQAAADQAEPLEEVFESAAYRRKMVKVFVTRALTDLLP